MPQYEPMTKGIDAIGEMMIRGRYEQDEIVEEDPIIPNDYHTDIAWVSEYVPGDE